MSRIRTPGSRRLLLLLALALAGRATAQTTGGMGGTVTDSASAPLPGVSLEARSPAMQGVRTATSDRLGLFRFPVLPPGLYTVSASLPGFKPVEETNLRVGLGETAFVPITMILAATAEVEIGGEPPLVDPATTRIGISMTGAEISQLPLGRNYTSVASTVAGTSQDSRGLTVYGATGLENQYIIDGLNTTGIRLGNQGKLLNAEFVQEVEVRTGGYEAEYGQVFGGNINVLTKSGGNEFHGDVFGYFDSEALASKDQHEADRNAVNAAQFTLPRRVDAGIDLGGYFVKDRLWFFGAFDRVASDEDYQRVDSLTYVPTGILSTLKDGTDETRTNLFSGKLTLRAGPSHTITASVFGDPTELNGRGSSSPGPDSAVLLTRKTGGADVTARWDGLFGPRFIVQAQYGYHEEKNRESNDFGDQLTIGQLRQEVFQFAAGSGPGRLGDETYRRNMYKLTGMAFLGSHEIKAGVNFENLNSSSSARFSGRDVITQFLDDDTGAFVYASHFLYARTPLNCVARTDGSRGNFGFIDPTTCNGWEVADGGSQAPTARNLALFAQDSWKIADNLTVNAGLRYEEQRILDPNGNAAIKLTGEWSPRVGVVWDPLKNGRSKVFLSFGRYYQVIPQDMQVRVLGNEFFSYAYNYTGDRLDNINDPAVGSPSAALFGSDFVPEGIKGMYQDEIVGGIELEVLKSWSIGLKGIYRAVGRVIEDRCDVFDPRAQIEGLVPPDVVNPCVVVSVGEGALGQISDPTNPDCFSDYPASTMPTPCEPVKARRYFRGLQLDLKHGFSNRFFLQASYLYSRLVGNFDGFVNEQGQPNPGLNGDFDYIDVVPNNFGRLSLDRTHQVKLSGFYSFPFGLQAGINSFFSSGRPLSLRGYARFFYFNHRHLVPRGSYDEMPSTYQVDLHLEYPLRLGAVSLSPILDVFNVTDVQPATNRNTNYNRSPSGDQSPPFTNPSNPRFGKDTAWQNPRIIRVGMRVSF